MSKKSYKNKITIMALIARTISAVAVTSSISFLGYNAEAITPRTSTQVQVGGGNATWFFFGYNPQKVEIKAGATVIWNVPYTLTAEPHTVMFVFNNKTMTYLDAPFSVATATKFMSLPPSSNSQPIVNPDNSRGMNTVILVNGRFPPGTSNTFSLTFEKAGTYNYLCILHPWMTGTVIVK